MTYDVESNHFMIGCSCARVQPMRSTRAFASKAALIQKGLFQSRTNRGFCIFPFRVKRACGMRPYFYRVTGRSMRALMGASA